MDSLLSRYQIRLFNGARRVAHRQGARLIGFQGSYLTNAEGERPVFDGSFLYDLAGPECVDGLIVVTNVLASGVGPEAVAKYCQRSGLCVVSVGELEGFPHIEIDNRSGLRRMIEHLVLDHGRKRLAFVRGASANPDSLERERVFRATLERLGAPVVEDWILPGNFLEGSGAAAVRMLLDERGVRPDAIDGIVAGNDQMASGAVRELSSRGLRVPNDLVVVGFDDDDHARNNSPPLTTVAQPVEQIAERAVELLLARIAGRDVPERTLMEAKPVWRRSCGCGRNNLVPPRSTEPAEPIARVLGRQRVTCLEQLERIAGPDFDPSGVDALIELVSAEDEERAVPARDSLEQAIVRTTEQGVDALRWQDVLAPVERALERCAPAEGPGAASARKHLLDAQLLVSEISARTRMLGQLYDLQLANGERVLASALACAKDFGALGRVLEAGLARLGIKYCCVCSFVGSTEPRLARITALYDPVEPPAADIPQNAEQLWRAVPKSLPPSQSPNRRFSSFPARALISPRAPATAAESDLLIYPLVFATDALGYVVFDAPPDVRRAWLLEGLAGHLSSAVYALLRAEELRRAREAAETASAAKSEFVAMMSHEVRTPLTAIIGHVDLCLQTSLSREQRAHLNRARASSRALLGIVNDILDFSKIEARKLALEAVAFELDDVIDQVVGSYAIPAARKGLEFVVDVDPAVPTKLTGDPLRLTQVLLNLVGNAIKFSHQGHVVLAVERDPSGDPRDVRFLVRDTGIGMTREQLELVFSPFTQADGSMTRRYGGTGLGLTISRSLVELMGGRLLATSEPDRGSEFSFTCRFETGSADALPASLPAGGRALVVEDEDAQARVLDRILRSAGYAVTRVRDAASAGARLAPGGEAAAFDVVIVDQTLPDRDGFELANRLLGQTSSAATTFVVARSPAPEPAPPSGAVILQKPFQRRTLLRALSRARDDAASSLPPGPGAAQTAPVLRDRKILLVQDEEICREMTRRVLELAGAEVRVATTGSEAIALGVRERFDLILMDVHLPVLDGYAAARAIRSHKLAEKTLIIALTASTKEEVRARCRAAGMNAFLSTPIDNAALLETLATELAKGERAVLGRQPSGFLEAMPGPEGPHALALSAELDTAGALERLNGDAALYQRLLGRFLATHRGTAQNVARALAQGNQERAMLLTHTLAASAANIGALHLHEVARALEKRLPGSASELGTVLTELELAEARAMSVVASLVDAAGAGSEASRTNGLAALGPALERLRRYLRDHDTAALDGLESLKPLVATHPATREPLRRLEASIAAYDFERARDDLETLSGALADDRS